MTKRNIVFVGLIVFITACTAFGELAKPESAPARSPTTARQMTATTARQMTATRRPTSTTRPTPTIAYLPVTWMELVSFLSDDHTNWNEYIPDHYVCLDFAIDLVENAGKQNIKAWVVIVDFYNQESNHAFAAFETTDRGTVFIEPQADVPYVNPKVGQLLVDAWQGRVFIGKIAAIKYLQCDSDHSHYCDPFIP